MAWAWPPVASSLARDMIKHAALRRCAGSVMHKTVCTVSTESDRGVRAGSQVDMRVKANIGPGQRYWKRSQTARRESSRWTLFKAISTLSLAHRSLLGDPAICQVPRAESAPSQEWGKDGSRCNHHVFPPSPLPALSTGWVPQGGARRSSLGGPKSGHSTHCPPPTFSSPRKNNATFNPRTKPPMSLAGNRYPHGGRWEEGASGRMATQPES